MVVYLQDETMKEGRTVGGLTFHQGVADADTWQVKDDQGNTVALVIVYVDDYLTAWLYPGSGGVHRRNPKGARGWRT